jgi:hypothetical protein
MTFSGSEFRSVGLAETKELHRFPVDKENIFKIDGEAAGSPF